MSEGRAPDEELTPRHDLTPRDAGDAYRLLRGAVEPILERNEAARAAFDAMRARGMEDAEAREEIARILIAVMFHVGARTERLVAGGGGQGLRAEAFRRLAEGETASQIFEE
jgi:hypothetical protein